jgi:hypothetical protein
MLSLLVYRKYAKKRRRVGCRHDCPSRVAVLQITAAAKSEKLPLRLLPLRSGCSSQAVCEVVFDTGPAQLFYNGLAVIPPVTPPGGHHYLYVSQNSDTEDGRYRWPGKGRRHLEANIRIFASREPRAFGLWPAYSPHFSFLTNVVIFFKRTMPC